MPRVLITGAAGFIGMHTSIHFLREGWDVVGLDNMNDYYSVALKRARLKEIEKEAMKRAQRFEMFEADLNSSVWHELGYIDFDAVIHLAAQAGVRYSTENPKAYLESNILGFQSVLEFVENKQIYRFVYASSSSVYGKSSKQPFSESEPCNQPESYYAATKISNELMAHSYFKTKGVVSVGLRFFTVYGPWGRPDMAPYIFLEAARKGSQIKVFNFGKQLRDFTFVADIVDGIYNTILNYELFNSADILNIGNGSPIQLMDFIRTIEKITDTELNKHFVEAQPGDVAATYACIDRISNKLQFRPRHTLHSGLEKFVKWYDAYYDEEKR